MKSVGLCSLKRTLLRLKTGSFGALSVVKLKIESTLATLNQRFPNADVSVLKPILEAIDDLNQLRELNLNASVAESFNAFRERLDALP